MPTTLDYTDPTVLKLDAADEALANLDDDGQQDSAFEGAIKAARHCIDACRELRFRQLAAERGNKAQPTPTPAQPEPEGEPFGVEPSDALGASVDGLS